MGRKPRFIGSSGYCHVVVRGNNHGQVFFQKSDFLAYRDFLEKYRLRCDTRIHHYCLMSNHVHLILSIPSSSALSNFMHGVQRSYFLFRQRQNKISGHLWEARYGLFPIEDESYLLEAGRYVERNPVKAGIVKRPEDYSWSSYRLYAYGTLDPLVEISPMYPTLGATLLERQAAYRTYVLTERSSDRKRDLADPKAVPGT